MTKTNHVITWKWTGASLCYKSELEDLECPVCSLVGRTRKKHNIMEINWGKGSFILSQAADHSNMSSYSPAHKLHRTYVHSKLQECAGCLMRMEELDDFQVLPSGQLQTRGQSQQQ